MIRRMFVIAVLVVLVISNAELACSGTSWE